MPHCELSDDELVAEWRRLQAAMPGRPNADRDCPELIALIQFTLLNLQRLTVLATLGVKTSTEQLFGGSQQSQSVGRLDFISALDKALARLRADNITPSALSMPKQRREQLALALAKRGEDIADGFRGIPVKTALDQQQMIAIIDTAGKAHLV